MRNGEDADENGTARPAPTKANLSGSKDAPKDVGLATAGLANGRTEAGHDNDLADGPVDNENGDLAEALPKVCALLTTKKEIFRSRRGV